MSDKDLVSKVYKRNLKTHRKANHPIFFLNRQTILNSSLKKIYMANKHTWGRKELDTTELNWTDSLKLLLFPNCLNFDIQARCAKFGQWIFIFPWTSLRIPGENAYPIREYSQAVLLISLNVSILDSETPINKFN